MHGRIRLHLEKPVHADGPGVAHPRQVVAHEIDDHDVLGLLLRACAQLGGEGRVRRGIRPARTGALDGACAGDAPLDRQELLRTGAQQRDVAAPEVPAVVRRARRAQAAVDGRRVERTFLGGRHLEPRREAQLIGIPLADGIAAAFDEGGVGQRIVATRGGGGCRCGGGRVVPGRGDASRQHARPLRGLRRPRHRPDSAVGMVERREALRAQPRLQRNACVRGRDRRARGVRAPLVPEPADPAAAERARRPVPGGGDIAPHAAHRTGIRFAHARSEVAPARARITTGIQPERAGEGRLVGGEEALGVRPAVHGDGDEIGGHAPQAMGRASP